VKEKLSVTQRFGQRVKQLRRQKHLSQEKLGEICDLDQTYISGIERGIRNPALRNIYALAKALGVSLSDLFEDI